MWFRQSPKRIYLDYAAATPLDPAVLSRMMPFLQYEYGNPSAIHKEGVRARAAIEDARVTVAKSLQVRPSGIIFTAHGTESNNIAILGRIEALHATGVAYADMEVISTAIEHPSILNTLLHIQTLGVRVVYAPVSDDGLIEIESFTKAITAKTVLCTFAYANSEVGVVQPVGKLARIVREKEKQLQTRIYVHVDAAQAPLWLPCELERLGVDVLSLDAGKCCGPKGVGVLAVRHDVSLSSIQYGGAQEGGMRPGTESAALIIGACAAIVSAQKQWEDNQKKIGLLRDAFIAKLCEIEGAVLNGHPKQRIANNINISIPGIDSEFAVVTLDTHGVACSTKSACGSGKGEGSEVVRIITKDDVRARATIRFTLGPATTLQELQQAAKLLSEHVQKMRVFASQTRS